MPSYKVISVGFINGRLYDPEGKRPVYHAEKPFPMKDKKEQVPSWMKAMPSETVAQARSRTDAEKKAAIASSKKAEADKKDIEDASFLGEGESSKTVETL